MEIRAITIYVVCDEVLKTLGIEDDTQAEMSNAEVIAFSIFASYFFGSNHTKARWFCQQMGYFPRMLSKSRLNRRFHQIPTHAWMAIFHFLGQVSKDEASTLEFAVDSFPVASCAKSRIDRRKLFKDRSFLGWNASKKKYFCGVKVHMIVSHVGAPVEVLFRPAAEGDLNTLWKLSLDLPPGSRLYADGAYACHELEDILAQDEGVTLLAKRGSTHTRRLRTELEERQISSRRQIVETAFSCITDLLPRYIRAVTEKGFLLKVLCTIIAFGMTRLA